MAEPFRILTLNAISSVGLKRFPAGRYVVGNQVDDPDAILVRSQDMHAMGIGSGVKAIGRAGAGTNNIPVTKMSARGVPVFNAPGANANAVKELVVAGMLLAARNLPAALDYVRGLQGDDQALHKAMEAGKKRFRGFELPGRVLGVVGLGAIGVRVANAAYDLGMQVAAVEFSDQRLLNIVGLNVSVKDSPVHVFDYNRLCCDDGMLSHSIIYECIRNETALV